MIFILFFRNGRQGKSAYGPLKSYCSLDIMLNHLEAGVTKHKYDCWGTTKTIMQEIIQDLTVFVAMPV